MRHHTQKRGHAHRIHIDSAGTHAYHVGEPPDPRTREVAEQRGVSMADMRARAVDPKDFEEYDYILAMDDANHAWLVQRCPAPCRAKVHLLTRFHPSPNRTDVPDPYYGGPRGFHDVFELVEASIEGLIDHLETTHLAQET